MTSHIHENENKLFNKSITVDYINAVDSCTGLTLLQVAANENDLKFFESIITKVIDLHEVHLYELSVEITEVLNRRLTFLKSEYKAGYSRLHIAVMDNEPNVVRYLMQHNLCDPNNADAPIGTALHLAILLGRSDCIDALLDGDVDVDIISQHQQTVLEMAIEFGLGAAILANLFSRSSDINGHSIYPHGRMGEEQTRLRGTGLTLLQVAVIHDWKSLIDMLLSLGADMLTEVKQPDDRSMAQLVEAIGARPTTLPLTGVENSLTLCVKCHNCLATGLQQRLGLDALQCTDGHGNSLLHLAAAVQNAELCQLLIDRGADVNFLNYEGGNPLQEMFRWRKVLKHTTKKPVSVGTMLIKAGIHVMMDDWNDSNILKDVLALNHESFFILVLEHAAMIDFSCIDFQSIVKRKWFQASNELIKSMTTMLRATLIDLEAVLAYQKHANGDQLFFLLGHCSQALLTEAVPLLVDAFLEKNDIGSFKLLLGTPSVPTLDCLANGETLLTHLMKTHRQEFVDILLDSSHREAFVTRRNAAGQSPLHVAISTRNVALVEILVLECADFNTPDGNGDTVFGLLFTSFAEYDKSAFVEKIAKIMITAGASPHSIDGRGVASIDYCLVGNVKERIIAFAQKRLAANSKDKVAECKICLNKPIECALECGHVYCNECAVRSKRCPTCRMPIKSIKKIFL